MRTRVWIAGGVSFVVSLVLTLIVLSLLIEASGNGKDQRDIPVEHRVKPGEGGAKRVAGSGGTLA